MEENATLPTDVWNNATTPMLEDADDLTHVRDFTLKVINAFIGTLGVIGNLFVIVIFIFFTKIADKVWFITARRYA